MISGEFAGGESQRRSGAVQMPAIRPSYQLETLQDLPLKSGPITLRGGQAATARGIFEVSDRSDAELLVEFPHALRPQAWYAQHFQHAMRGQLAHGCELRVLSGAVQLRDHRGESVADAGQLPETVFGDELVQWQRAQ